MQRLSVIGTTGALKLKHEKPGEEQLGQLNTPGVLKRNTRMVQSEIGENLTNPTPSSYGKTCKNARNVALVTGCFQIAWFY